MLLACLLLFMLSHNTEGAYIIGFFWACEAITNLKCYLVCLLCGYPDVISPGIAQICQRSRVQIEDPVKNRAKDGSSLGVERGRVLTLPLQSVRVECVEYVVYRNCCRCGFQLLAASW